MFTLHPQFTKDCLEIGDSPFCRVLLMNDRRFPWVILIPKREGVTEIHHLAEADLAGVVGEIAAASKFMESIDGIDKVNVAALGNMVPQLHIHVIARRKSDAAWPKPVWGVGVAEPYSEDEISNLRNFFYKGLALG
ncbi:MAG: HIT domain-containing protein [Alphaproteobacteria bacterium]|nr:HIT domain-containing protein [Rhodospirillales bacterium]MCW9046303.1 HIT domain-containing protein [Alphaproteobacteria bacterium]